MGSEGAQKSISILIGEIMSKFMSEFRKGRNEARAVRGAPPLPRRERDAWDGDEAAPAERNDGAGNARLAELEPALGESGDELANTKRLLGEMADYAEKMEARVIELIAGAEPMAKTLRLPGVKTYLLQRFHPDKYPDADAEQRGLLTNALKTINAAYALAGTLNTAGGDDEAQSPA
jgi:hypothetical protein